MVFERDATMGGQGLWSQGLDFEIGFPHRPGHVVQPGLMTPSSRQGSPSEEARPTEVLIA